jgi:cytochrome c2
MAQSRSSSLGFLLAWHSLVIAILLLLPGLKYPIPFWHLVHPEQLSLLLMVAAYVVCALLYSSARNRAQPIGLPQVLMMVLAVFGVAFFYLLAKKIDSSRAVMIYILVATIVTLWLLGATGRSRIVSMSGLAIVAAALLALNFKPPSTAPRKVKTHVDTQIVNTGFYNLHAVLYQDYMPPPAVSGGGLSRVGDGLMLATGDGHLYLLNWGPDPDALTVHPLPYRVPINGDEFAADNTGKPWARPASYEPPINGKEDAGSEIFAFWFRVAGLQVQEIDGRLRIFATHYFWKREQSCWVERLSMLEGERAVILSGAQGPQWQTIFESQPCLPIKGEGRRRGTAFAGHFGGGRVRQLDADTLLMSVGDFGFNGIASRQMLSQDPSASYGKIIRIHINSRKSEIYSLGVRNPQGLYVDPNGKIWETEHGPQGGDELNLIKEGANYGWPIVTYGTDYGTFTWPLNPKQGEQEGFEQPYYSWLPSIGVSDLIGVEQASQFPIWHGDLLVTSLNGQTIYRIRMRNDRVVYSEPIKINDKRMREIAEAKDGRIVIWEDDDNTIVSLTPLTGTSGEALFATHCSGCHKIGDGTSHRIGPDLYGVVGRRVAFAGGYLDYSPALRKFGGKWSEDRLSKFLMDPQALVPGSAMEFAGLSDEKQRTLLIDYIKHADKVILP